MEQSSTRARPSALEALRVNVIVGRARARFSQSELAKRAGLSRPTISRLERAASDIGVDAIQRIADALGTTVSNLFLAASDDHPGDDELALRAQADDDSFIDADALLEAIDESAGRPCEVTERYSKAGRPAVVRKSPQTSRQDNRAIRRHRLADVPPFDRTTS